MSTNIFDYVSSHVKLVKISKNHFEIGDKKWVYDPDIEINVPSYYKRGYAEEVVKLLKAKRHRNSSSKLPSQFTGC